MAEVDDTAVRLTTIGGNSQMQRRVARVGNAGAAGDAAGGWSINVGQNNQWVTVLPPATVVRVAQTSGEPTM